MAKKRKATGDCFERAYHLLVDGIWKGQRIDDRKCGEPRLVHGVVWHEKRGYHVHGWVEDDIFSYDFIDGKLFTLPKGYYYRVGRITDTPQTMKRYTKAEAMQAASDTGIYSFDNVFVSPDKKEFKMDVPN